MKKIETLEPRCSNGQKSSQLGDNTVRPGEKKEGEENVTGRDCEVETETELEDFEAKAEGEEYMKVAFPMAILNETNETRVGSEASYQRSKVKGESVQDSERKTPSETHKRKRKTRANEKSL